MTWYIWVFVWWFHIVDVADRSILFACCTKSLDMVYYTYGTYGTLHTEFRCQRGLEQELGLMVTSRWSAVHSFSTLEWAWQAERYITLGGCFAPPKDDCAGDKRMWRDLWVWPLCPLDTDRLMSSPLYIFPSWFEIRNHDWYLLLSSYWASYFIERSIVGLLFMQIWLVQTNF